MNSRRIMLLLLMTATGIACQAGSVEMAQASCGDYLEGHRPARDGSTIVDDQAERAELPAVPNHTCPCQGPRCQKAPSAPTLPAPTKIAPTIHEQLCGCPSMMSLPTSDRSRGERDARVSLAAGHQQTIEHPPRVRACATLSL